MKLTIASVLALSFLLVVLALPAQAQTTYDTDNFDTGETVGQPPTSDWYTFSGAQGTVSTEGSPPSGTQWYKQQTTGSSTNTFTLTTPRCTDSNVVTTSFVMKPVIGGASALSQALSMTGPAGSVGVFWGNDLTIRAFSSVAGFVMGTPVSWNGDLITVVMSVNCSSGLVTVDFSGPGVPSAHTSTADGGPLPTITSFKVQSTNNAIVYVDNLYMSTNEQAPAVEEPSEFDSGLLVFITGLGFITPESQFFFALIVVGIATVTTGVVLKFMAPGKTKLIIISVTAMLMGAFFSILNLYDFWMFIVSLTLGVTILQGTKEFRNTFSEIRATIAKQVEGFRSREGGGDEEEAEQAMSGKTKVTMEEVDDSPIEAIDGWDSPEPKVSEVDDVVDRALSDSGGSGIGNVKGTENKSYGSDVSEV